MNLVATGVARPSSGLLTRDAIAVVRLAPRDRRRRADRGGAPRRSRPRRSRSSGCAGKWHALRATRGRAGAPLPRRPASGRRASSSSSGRWPGSRPRRRGVELGRRHGWTTRLEELLDGADERRYEPLRDARRDASRPVPVPGARSRVAPAARRPRRRRDPRRRHGAREDRAGDRDARLGTRGRRGRRRADARRQPDERRAAVGAGDRPLRARAPRPPPPRAGAARPAKRSSPRHGRATSSSPRTTSRRATSSSCRAVEWDRLLLDEAQDAEEPRTKRHRALRRIPRRRALALTGTPIENRLSELWAIMDLVNPGLARLARGVRANARPSDRGTAGRPRARAAPLARRPVRAPSGEGCARGRHRAAADHDLEGAVPPDGRAGEPLPRDRRPMDAADRGARAGVRPPRRRSRDARAAEAGLQPPRARRPDGSAHSKAAPGSSSASSSCLAAVPEDEKALVFTQYPGFDRLAPHLEHRLGRQVGFFHGGLSIRARDELVARFESEAEPSVLVVSLRAGGQGAEPPGREPRPPLRPLVEPGRRAAGDGSRPPSGPARPVYVSSLVCTATLEERIDALLDAKRELADQVMAGRADDWLVRARPRRDPRRGRARARGGRGGCMTEMLLADGAPIAVAAITVLADRSRAVGAASRDGCRPGRGLGARGARPRAGARGSGVRGARRRGRDSRSRPWARSGAGYAVSLRERRAPRTRLGGGDACGTGTPRPRCRRGRDDAVGPPRPPPRDRATRASGAAVPPDRDELHVPGPGAVARSASTSPRWRSSSRTRSTPSRRCCCVGGAASRSPRPPRGAAIPGRPGRCRRPARPARCRRAR